MKLPHFIQCSTDKELESFTFKSAELLLANSEDPKILLLPVKNILESKMVKLLKMVYGLFKK